MWKPLKKRETVLFCTGLKSCQPIPFKFTPALANVLKLPFSDRFLIEKGMCHLSDSDSTPCTLCGHSEWVRGPSTVVTQNQTLLGFK